MLSTSLREGLRLADKAGTQVLYRYLQPDDDVDAITDLLHEAYAPLATKGMRFFASHQDSSMTRQRFARGETIVAEQQGAIIGVVTLQDVSSTHGSEFYERADVAGFGQFAVRPSCQGRGIGAALLDLVEQRAREQGVVHLALDTSEHAKELIALYQSRGFQFVEHLQWPDTNYRSAVLAKRLV